MGSATHSMQGFVNAHSHAFQRGLRGTGSVGDFWAWRDLMLIEAGRQTPEMVRSSYAATYEEMRRAGFTAVGEFHYLGLAEAAAAVDAARATGIEIVLLLTAYERGGIARFRQTTVAEYLQQVESLRSLGVAVGLAPHSVRACSREWLVEIGRYADREGLVLHVHADEQPREVDECLAEHGVRPIELLSLAGCLGPRTTLVHATHASDTELDLISEAGSGVCVCPTTEANLGDGYAPVRRLRDRGIPICIGSDSNVRIDPLEELRELEGIARRETGARDIVPVETLMAIGSTHGARALGLSTWPSATVDLSHPTLRGVRPQDVDEALVFSCGADVFTA